MVMIEIPEKGDINNLYDNEKERKMHLNAIDMLTLRSQASREDIEKVYGIVLKRFKKASKVKDFLPILVSKKVEHLLTVRMKRKQEMD